MRTRASAVTKSLLLLAALLLPPAAGAAAPAIKAPQVDTPKRILFVGNSYLYYGDSLHNHVGRLAVAGNPSLAKALQYKSATIGGANLAHHNIEYLTEPGRIGVKEPFELVILQDGSAAPLSEERRALSMEKIREYSEIIRKRGGQVALYMNHVYVPPHKQAKPENIRLTEAHYLAAGNAVKALIIPVGLAFEEAYRRRPDIKLHKDFDGTHPELIGTYLAACVVYASVYGKSPVGNAYDYYGRISKEDAAFLQQVAEDTVKKFFGR
ncbi:MAG: hypothetical protein KF804_05655 [Burkholderiales bacterium]|jgi:hypothetical protein|nr:hypothetical protein [Burkholderiales bacterium]